MRPNRLTVLVWLAGAALGAVAVSCVTDSSYHPLPDEYRWHGPDYQCPPHHVNIGSGEFYTCRRVA